MRSSQEKQRTRAAPTPTRRTRPVHYRLTKSEAEVEAEARAIRNQRATSIRRDDDDYTPFLLSMLGTAIFFFVVQTLASILIANYQGATIEIDLWMHVAPYILMTVEPSSFVAITTWSSVTTVVLGTLRAMSALVFQRKNPQVIDGRSTALLMGGLLLVYQYVRHTFNPPLIDTWVYAQTMAGIVAATVIYLGFRPTVHQSAYAERSARSTPVERTASPTQTTEQRKSRQP